MNLSEAAINLVYMPTDCAKLPLNVWVDFHSHEPRCGYITTLGLVNVGRNSVDFVGNLGSSGEEMSCLTLMWDAKREVDRGTPLRSNC